MILLLGQDLLHAGNSDMAGTPVDCTFHDDTARLAVPAVGYNTFDMISTARGAPSLGRLDPATVRRSELSLPSISYIREN